MCLLKGILAGSLERSILQVACSLAATNAVSPRVEHVQGGELANLVGLLSKHLAIQDNEVGTDVDELRPAAVNAAAGVYAGDNPWPTSMFRKGGGGLYCTPFPRGRIPARLGDLHLRGRFHSNIGLLRCPWRRRRTQFWSNRNDGWSSSA